LELLNILGVGDALGARRDIIHDVLDETKKACYELGKKDYFGVNAEI
jgi:hypothetical protein